MVIILLNTTNALEQWATDYKNEASADSETSHNVATAQNITQPVVLTAEYYNQNCWS